MNGWRHYSACRDADPDVFFQENGKPSAKLAAICSGCPVLLRCTFDALRRNDSGYQAGLTKADRDRIRNWDKRQKARLAGEGA